MKTTFAALFLTLATLGPARSASIEWDNGAGNNVWLNATNWAGNALPLATDDVKINLGGANRAVFSTGTSTYNLIRVGDLTTGAELQVTGGALSSSSTTPTRIATGGRTATVNQSSGTLTFGGYMQLGLDANSIGNINLTGGTLISSRNGTIGGVPSVSVGLGDGNNAQGNLVISGGELRTRTGVLLGANGGRGRFEVRGAGVANLGVDNAADDGFWVQNSNSVLAAYVTNGALGSIYVANLSGGAGTYSDGNVIFMPGAKLEVGFLGATNAGSWDLMTWDGALLTNGLSFAASVTDTNWSFAFVDTDGTNGVDTLRLIYISANLNPPTGLVAVSGNAQATLRWTPTPGATNYIVKRATTPGGPYVPLVPSVTSASLTDTGLTNGVTYYYVVSAGLAIGSTGNSSEVRATPFNKNFIHPGVMHAQGDLDRMRDKVVANEQPWADGYAAFAADSHSSAAYAMQGPFPFVRRAGAGESSQNLSQWENDCGGAYQNAVMWYLTGDPDHANKAMQILDAWAGTCTNILGSDARLTAGLQGHKFITAAELIRYTGAAWSPAQINTVSNFIRTVLLPHNRMYGGGNWGNIGAISQMAAGVFMDDEAEFNDAINAIRYGAPTQCDMGLDNYINPLGWTTEADRDIGHWALGLMNLGAGAQIAWCQGVDLWSVLNYRLQVGHEYIAKYNLSNSVTYAQPQQCDGYNNGGLTSDGRGRWDISYFELSFHPYENLFGLASPWTWAGVTNTRAYFAGPDGYNDGIEAERYDRDHVAFGTLVSALPPRQVGLPHLPIGLMASASNGVVALSWTAATNATGYKVKRATARSGPYATFGTLAATSYADATVANGQLYFYKISATNAVGETADSGLASAYPSANPLAAPTSVVATGISHQRIDVTWPASVGATSYNVSRGVAPGGPFTNIASGVGTTFLTYADTGLPANTTFYYVVAANHAVGTGANSGAASATTRVALPAPWTFADAGYPTTPGHATYTNGTFTVRGAGLDYGGLYNSDAFGFAYLPLTGDGEIVARYAARANYSIIHKSGIAMRESLGDESRHMFAYIGGDNTANVVYRTNPGNNGTGSGSTNVPGSTLPQWLKLNRTGNVFTGSVSADGVNWSVINVRTISMSSTILVGFAVCSRNNGYLDTATFDNVSVTGLWPALPVPPAPLVGVPGDARATLSWPSSANSTGYNLKRGSASGGPFTLIGTNLGTLAFTNTGLANGALYYYVVSGTNFFGESANSAAVAVRPVSTASPQLDFAIAANQMLFNWPTSHIGWKLQVQTNDLNTGLSNNWFTIGSSSATNQIALPVDAANGAVFYRLTYP